MNEGRNLFRCLSKEDNYVFSLEKYDEMKYFLKEMIFGIKNFLSYVKESIEINYFIYFGEYELNHIYQINDFLSNINSFNFYRIYEVRNSTLFTKIILTTIYSNYILINKHKGVVPPNSQVNMPYWIYGVLFDTDDMELLYCRTSYD